MGNKDTLNRPTLGDAAPADMPPDQNAVEVRNFLDRLSEEERMLVLLKQELYDGSWAAMRRDLENRLNGKPYIFKLANRIRDDIGRIDKLEAFERAHRVNLSHYFPPPE